MDKRWCVVGLLWPVLAQAACEASSPAYSVPLLELYTSEGCSSCPPADQALRQLRRDAALTGKVVALAWHVDYWDALGWRDRFAQPAFARRQRQLVQKAGQATVYTPQFFLQGRPYGHNLQGLAQALESPWRQAAPADIALTLQPVQHGRLPLQVHTTLRLPGPHQLQLVLYEHGLQTLVAAGENRGAILLHDYVVRQWLPPLPLNGASGQFSVQLTLPAGQDASRLGVAAFVEDSRSLQVRQALARPLCRS